jgi:hypothetical protein
MDGGEKVGILKRLGELAASKDRKYAHLLADEALLDYIADADITQAYLAIKRSY